MKRYDINKSSWAMPRHDVAMEGSSRRNAGVCRRDNIGFQRPPADDTEMENRNLEETQPADPVANKLDRLLDRFDKLDSWRDETDRRFQNLEPPITREPEPPYDHDDADDMEYGEYRRRRQPYQGHRARNPNARFRDHSADGRGNRALPDDDNAEFVNYRGDRYNQSDNYHGEKCINSCWDPPTGRPQ